MLTFILCLLIVIATLVAYIKNPIRVRKQKKRLARRQRREQQDRYWNIYDWLFQRLKYKRISYFKSDEQD